MKFFAQFFLEPAQAACRKLFMIGRERIPKRAGYYWAKVSLGGPFSSMLAEVTEVQPIELIWFKDEPRAYILGCEANALDAIQEFVAPLDAPKGKRD